MLCNPTFNPPLTLNLDIAPGLTRAVGTRNDPLQGLVSGDTVHKQLWPVRVVVPTTLTTDDVTALFIASAAGVTLTLPNPGATEGADYNFGSDGVHGYTLTTVGGTRTIYGCQGGGGTSLTLAANVDARLVDDGTNYKCTSQTAATGGGTSCGDGGVPGQDCVSTGGTGAVWAQQITGAPGPTPGDDGATTSIVGGAGNGNGDGGPAIIVGGAAGATGSIGGSVTIVGGASPGGSFGNGGPVVITSGASDAATDGSVMVQSPNAGAGAAPGSVSVRAGNSGAGSSANGAGIALRAGNGANSRGGPINLTAGTGGTDGSELGGSLNLLAGAGGTNGPGGSVNLSAGAGTGGLSTNDAIGGSIYLTSGAAGTTGTSQISGDIHIATPNAPAIGKPGGILIVAGDGGSGVDVDGGAIGISAGTGGGTSGAGGIVGLSGGMPAGGNVGFTGGVALGGTFGHVIISAANSTTNGPPLSGCGTHGGNPSGLTFWSRRSAIAQAPDGDNSGLVSVGDDGPAVTACTITFNNPFNTYALDGSVAVPVCQAMVYTTTPVPVGISAISPTAVTFTFASNISGQKFSYWCVQ